MLVVDGSFEEIKASMKRTRQSILNESKAIRKQFRYKAIPKKEQAALAENEKHAKMYSVVRVLPVKVENTIINYKLYAAFMKRLKGFQTRISVTAEGITIQYWKRGIRHTGKGTLTLYDLSFYFINNPHVPIARIRDE